MTAYSDKEKNWNYSFQLGFSFEKDAVSLPVAVNFVTAHCDHHAEFSFTVIPYFRYYDDQVERNYSGKSDKYIFLHPGAGYRFQKPDRTLFLNSDWTITGS